MLANYGNFIEGTGGLVELEKPYYNEGFRDFTIEFVNVSLGVESHQPNCVLYLASRFPKNRRDV